MDTFTLYLDQPTVFECSLSVDGFALSRATARLVVDSPDLSTVFYGTISPMGAVAIPVREVDGIYADGTTGTVRLEIIADDVYVQAWEAPCTVTTARKVAVVDVAQHAVEAEPTAVHAAAVAQPEPVEESKPTRKITVSKKPTLDDIAADIVKALAK